MKNNLIVITIFLAFLSSTPVRAIEYSFTPLGDIGGYMVANDINDAGQIVGAVGFQNSQTSQTIHGLLFNDGQIQKVGLPGELVSQALKINNNGEVIGRSLQYDSLTDTAVNINYYHSSGETRKLPDASGFATGLTVIGVNDNNQVIFDQGPYYYGGLTTKSFLYENNQFKQLGFLGGSHTNVSDINNVGQVVGGATIPQTDFDGQQLTRAYIYEGGVMTEVPLIENDGSLPALNESFANAVNDFGNITGNLYKYDESLIQTNSAFLYRNGVMEDLGSLGELIGPQDINNFDQIVGTYIDFDESGERIISAFTYQDELGLVDLNSLLDSKIVDNGWVLNEANAINNKGQIVGVASNANYKDSVFSYILTPVPEPETYVMLVGGLALIRLISRHKRKLN